MDGRKFAEPSHSTAASIEAPASARRLEDLGDVHAGSENAGVALGYLEAALAELTRGGAPSAADVARLLRKTAECRERRGDLDGAAADLLRARRLLMGAGPAQRAERAVLLGRSAMVAHLAGAYRPARRLGLTALAVLRSSSEHAEVARVESCLGAVHQRLGQLDAAREFHENALATYRRIRDDAGVARSLNNIANILRMTGAFREAIGYYQKAVHLNESAGNHAQLAGNCLNLGIVHTFLAQWPQAEAALARGRRLAEQTGNAPQIARALIGEAIVARRRGEYARGLAALEHAGTIAEGSGLQREAALVLEFRGEILGARGEIAAAEAELSQALAQARAIAPEGDIVLEVLRRLADLHVARGDEVIAAREADDALVLAERIGDRVEGAAATRVLATLAARRGDWERARGLLDDAITSLDALGERWELAQTYVIGGELALADCADAPRAELGRVWFRRAEALGLEIEDPSLAARAGLGLARGELARTRLDAVFHHLDSASALADGLAGEQRDRLVRELADLRSVAEQRAVAAAGGSLGKVRLIEQVNALLRGSTNALDALGKILQLLADTIGCDRAFVATRRDGRERVMVAHGLRQDGAEALLAALQAGALLDGETTLVSTSVGADPRVAGEAALAGVRSFIVCPLGLPAREAGWLYVDRLLASATGPFLSGDVTAVAVLAGLATAGVLEAEHAILARDYAHLRAQLAAPAPFAEVITQNAAMLEVLRLVEKVGPSDARVLLEGETGTGKGLLARCIHAVSRRQAQSFVQINCAALPEPLLESELFGHVQGAFTGAVRDKAGLFEEANKGTLFLDEVDKTSEGIQGKLLHVLDRSEIRPVGANKWRNVDTRVICATNVDLAGRIRERRFLEDLFYRLNDIVISVPPLRDRRDDIPLLAHHFLDRFRAAMEKPVRGFDEAVMARLVAYEWPGNVRELEKAVRRMLVLADPGETITEELLPLAIRGGDHRAAPSGTLREEIERVERRMISETLESCGWNRSLAARRLHVSYPCLLAKIRQFGLTPSTGKTLYLAS